MKKVEILMLSLAVAACLSCKEKPRSTVSPEEAPRTKSPPPAKEVTAKSTMQGHFANAITAKDTLLFGDIEISMKSMRWLADNGASDDDDSAWRPHTGRISQIARDTVGTKNVEVMAMAVAQIARECGACHAALGAEPKIPVVATPPAGEEFSDHMIGHKWSLDRMWAGLTTPSPELWLGGAEHLAGQPSHFRNLSSYGKSADAAMDYATTVHTLAEEARKENQADRQMAIFGRFLAACAGCHALSAGAADSESAAP